MVKAENIHKSFGQVQVLKGVNLEILQGKLYSIVGASGAGKTTLLQILGTLSLPNKGEVYIHGQKISDFSEKQLASFRNLQLGFVFQFHHLLPEFTALENVCIPAFIAGKTHGEAKKRALELLGYLGLENRSAHKPSELSGGEKQRVAVARALVNNPVVVMADEPSGNLDSQNRDELHELFFALRNDFGHTFIIVTHDNSFAERSDSIIHIKDGVIEK
ncbi:MAG: ABC transporter ATP-binding protein [Prolixibacteraceae bacterium]|nr:ABC transporter ATP-binding protein [Prolixibacteraceae bacterium]